MGGRKAIAHSDALKFEPRPSLLLELMLAYHMVAETSLVMTTADVKNRGPLALTSLC